MTARIVLLVAGAMAFLAASAAFAFQAVRNQPEVTVPVAVTAVPAQETVTPLTARPVRTVSIIKPGATLQNGSQFNSCTAPKSMLLFDHLVGTDEKCGRHGQT